MNKGSGCKKCPVNEWDCDAQYRGSRCAALRAEHRADYDPFTNSDHFRSLNDEELAQALIDFVYELFEDGEPAVEFVTDWLRRPKEQEG